MMRVWNVNFDSLLLFSFTFAISNLKIQSPLWRITFQMWNFHFQGRVFLSFHFLLFLTTNEWTFSTFSSFPDRSNWHKQFHMFGYKIEWLWFVFFFELPRRTNTNLSLTSWHSHDDIFYWYIHILLLLKYIIVCVH